MFCSSTSLLMWNLYEEFHLCFVTLGTVTLEAFVIVHILSQLFLSPRPIVSLISDSAPRHYTLARLFDRQGAFKLSAESCRCNVRERSDPLRWRMQYYPHCTFLAVCANACAVTRLEYLDLMRVVSSLRVLQDSSDSSPELSVIHRLFVRNELGL